MCALVSGCIRTDVVTLAPPSGITMEAAGVFVLPLPRRKVTPQRKWRWLSHIRDNAVQHSKSCWILLPNTETSIKGPVFNILKGSTGRKLNGKYAYMFIVTIITVVLS